MAPLASLATITSGLEAVATGFSALPLWFVLGGHVVFCAHHFKGKYGDRYLLNLILGFSLAFGGGILTSILLQRPDLSPFPLLGSDTVALYWIAGWWAVNYSPFDVVSRLLDFRVPRLLAAIGLCGLRAATVAQRVDLARKLYPGTLVGPVLLGTLGASGGGLIVDAVEISAGYSRGPAELARPTDSLWSGLVPALSHLLLVHVLGVASSAANLGLWIAVYYVHLAGSVVANRLLPDWTAPFRDAFHALSRIPPPQAADVAEAGGEGKGAGPGNGADGSEAAAKGSISKANDVNGGASGKASDVTGGASGKVKSGTSSGTGAVKAGTTPSKSKDRASAKKHA